MMKALIFVLVCGTSFAAGIADAKEQPPAIQKAMEARDAARRELLAAAAKTARARVAVAEAMAQLADAKVKAAKK